MSNRNLSVTVKLTFVLFILIIDCFIIQVYSAVGGSNNFRGGGKSLKNEVWVLSPINPWVLTNGAVMLRLEPENKTLCSKDGCKECTVNDPTGNSFNPKPLTEEGTEYSVKNGYPDKVRIGSTAAGGCYSLISSVTSISDGFWEISANDHHNSTKVFVIPNPKSSQTLMASVGRSATIDCRTSVTSITLFYCHILDNNGQPVSNDCTYSINPVREEHKGNWTCMMAFRGSMMDVKHIVTIILQESDYMEGKVFTKGTKTHLQCSMKNSNAAFSWCRATSPKGNSFLLSSGLLHGRYSALGTSVPDRVCSLEIDSINKEDHGIWRVEIGLTNVDTIIYTGCILKLPQDYVFNRESIKQEPSIQVVKVGDSLRLTCSVPWPSAYCYAIKPDGTPIRDASGNGQGERLLKIGICAIVSTNITVRDSGRWTCGLASDNGSKDVNFFTDVEVMSGQLAPMQTGLQLVSGDSAVLLCRSPLRQPLKYCRFSNPQGDGFSLKPNIITESRFSYHGSGLEEGECGVRISEVRKEDIGTWICAATFVSFPLEEYATITIAAIEPTVGFKVGMGLGAAAIVTLLMAGATILYRRRINAGREEQMRILRNTPENSTEHIDGFNDNTRSGCTNQGTSNTDSRRIMFLHRPSETIVT